MQYITANNDGIHSLQNIFQYRYQRLIYFYRKNSGSLFKQYLSKRSCTWANFNHTVSRFYIGSFNYTF